MSVQNARHRPCCWLLRKTPTFEFLGRGNRVSDLVGEKLNETFVGKVLDSVLTGESRYRMLVPTQIERRRYILLLDQTESSPLRLALQLRLSLQKPTTTIMREFSAN